MKIKKILSLILFVSLVSTTVYLPHISAFIEEEEATENIIIENFNDSKIENGITISDCNLAYGELELSDEDSAMFISREFSASKRYEIDFGFKTEVSYDKADEEKGTYAGFYLEQAGIRPEDGKKGVWLIANAEKVFFKIFGSSVAKEILVIDKSAIAAEFSFVIDGMSASVLMNGEEIAVIGIESGTLTVTAGEESVSVTGFNYTARGHYFGIAHKAKTEKAYIDNFSLYEYQKTAATLEQVEEIIRIKTEAGEIIESVKNNEGIYLASSVSIYALDEFISLADMALLRAKSADDPLLAKDASEIITKGDALLAAVVTAADAERYKEILSGYKEKVEATDSLEDVEKTAIIDEIDEAIAYIDGDGVTKKKLDELEKKAVETILSYTDEISLEVTRVEESMTDISEEDFNAKFTQSGNNLAAKPYASENGFEFSWVERYGLMLKENYPTYELGVTVDMSQVNRQAIALRQLSGADMWEDEDIATGILGSHGIILMSKENGRKLYLAAKKGIYNSTDVNSRVYLEINVPEGCFDGDVVRYIVRDFNDYIEIYAGKNEESLEFIASITLDAVITGQDAMINNSRWVRSACYTNGKLKNEITGEEISFSGMKIPVSESSFVGFSIRGGKVFIKDIVLKSDIVCDKDILVISDKTEIKSLTVNTDKDVYNVGETVNVTVTAECENLKVAGRNAYENRSLDLTNMAEVSAYFGAVKVKDGIVTATKPGSERITANVELNGETYNIDKNVTVMASGEENVISGKVISAEVYNAPAFVSVNAGDELVIGLRYTLENGKIVTANENIKTDVVIADTDVLTYADGKIKAEANGVTSFYVTLYWNNGSKSGTFNTLPVFSEVTDDAAFGKSEKASAMMIYEAVCGDYTKDEKDEFFEKAAETGLSVDATETSRAYIIKEMELLEGADAESALEAYSKGVIIDELKTLCKDKKTTSDKVKEYLITEGRAEALGIDLEDYNDLSESKKTGAVRDFIEAVNDENAPDSVKIGKLFDKAVEGKKGSGGGGGSDVKDKTVSVGGGMSANTSQTTVKKEENKVFSDLDNNHWAKDAVIALAVKNVITGYPDGTFKPGNFVTRDEFVKMIVVVAGYDVNGRTGEFKDVTSDAWQNPYIAAAFHNGLVGGIGERIFGSGRNITRQDLAVIIYRYLESKGISANGTGNLAFADSTDISGYAKTAVAALCELGIVNGREENMFAPLDTATRAECALMLYRVSALVK